MNEYSKPNFSIHPTLIYSGEHGSVAVCGYVAIFIFGDMYLLPSMHDSWLYYRLVVVSPCYLTAVHRPDSPKEPKVSFAIRE